MADKQETLIKIKQAYEQTADICDRARLGAMLITLGKSSDEHKKELQKLFEALNGKQSKTME